ncbi:MAG: hypothetical protein ACK5LX_04730 [Oscillospiraceae bacterium]
MNIESKNRGNSTTWTLPIDGVGRITIPQPVRESLNIRHRDKFSFTILPDTTMVVKKMETRPAAEIAEVTKLLVSLQNIVHYNIHLAYDGKVIYSVREDTFNSEDTSLSFEITAYLERGQYKVFDGSSSVRLNTKGPKAVALLSFQVLSGKQYGIILTTNTSVPVYDSKIDPCQVTRLTADLLYDKL